jgi:AmiR/NasT family two-component response regulator
MGKYSDIVKSKNQSDEPDLQKTVKEESIETIDREISKTSEPENQKTIQEEMVNLSIKVPRRLRQKWVAESRLRGTTLTAIISDYLKTELGE